MKTLILGGVRSGKSRLAQQLAERSGLPVTFIATATANDPEMQARIQTHQLHRPAHWRLIEVPVHLASALKSIDHADVCILVDCLTLWLTNLLLTEDHRLLETECDGLLRYIQEGQGKLLVVSNEINMGVIPMGELSRSFCDEAGKLHQTIAKICDTVVLTVAGLPLLLKGDLS